MAINTGNSFLGLKFITQDETMSVAASNGTINYTLTPPIGQIYKIKNIFLAIEPPIGASSGTHRVYLKPNGTLYQGAIVSTFDHGVYIRYYAFEGNSTEQPSGATEQMNFLLNAISCSSTVPFVMRYDNNTDVEQTDSMELQYVVEIYKEVL